MRRSATLAVVELLIGFSLLGVRSVFASGNTPSITPSTLVDFLLPNVSLSTDPNGDEDNNGNGSDANSTAEFDSDSVNVYGQTLVLRPFQLTVVTNTTHALVAVNVSKSVSEIGYVSVGFGHSMSDSSIVVCWPVNDDGSQWAISLRSAYGYHQPVVSSDESIASQASALTFAIQQDLFDTWTDDNAHSHTLVSFIRPLTFADGLSPFEHYDWLNLSRETDQNLVYAYSDRRPDGDDVSTAHVHMHDPGMFGWSTVDLSQTYLDTSTGDGDQVKDGQGWTTYDTIVFAHAGMAMITYLLLAPLGVLIARFGRHLATWFKWHSSVQGYVTIPATFAVVAVGMLAAYTGSSTGITSHKFLGFLILFLALFLLGLGYWSHKQPHQKGEPRPWYRIVHILVGQVTIIFGFIQIWLGFKEYKGRERSRTVTIIYAVFVGIFAILYGSAVLLFIRRRRGEGYSLRYAMTAFGNEAPRKNNSSSQAWAQPYLNSNDGNNSDTTIQLESTTLSRTTTAGTTGSFMTASQSQEVKPAGERGDLSAWLR